MSACNPLAGAYDLHIPHAFGRRARTASCVLESPGSLEGERNRKKKEEIKSQSCYCERENKGNEISKLGKFYPIILSINLKAFKKLKLMCDIIKCPVNRNMYLYIVS